MPWHVSLIAVWVRLTTCLAVLAQIGCASQIRPIEVTIDSTAAQWYQGIPEKIFIGVHNHELTEDFNNGFLYALEDPAVTCGVETQAYFVSEQDRIEGSGAFAEAGKTSNSDAYLAITAAKRGMRRGRIAYLVYEATLRDVSTPQQHKKIWIATIRVDPGPHKDLWPSVGAELPRAIFEDLRYRNILDDCNNNSATTP